jgi:hypothetical protein
VLFLGRLLTFVACLPLLQPNGFCVCKWVRLGLIPTHSTISTTSQVEPTCSKNTCCSSNDCSSKEQKQENIKTCTHCGQSEPSSKDEHRPDCPESYGVTQSKFVETAPSLAHLWLPTSGLLVALPTPFVSRLDADSRPIQPCGRPLYLTHCTFTI